MISVNDEKELRGFEVQTNLSGDDIEKLLSDTKRLHTEFIHNNQHVSIAGERSTDGLVTMISLGHYQEIGQLFMKFQREKYLCDTVLVGKDKQVEAHSLLLAAASPVLKSAIDADMALGSCGQHYIRLLHIESEVLEIIVQFIYTGNLALSRRFSQFEALTTLLHAMDELGVKHHNLNGCLVKFRRNRPVSKKNYQLIQSVVQAGIQKGLFVEDEFSDWEDYTLEPCFDVLNFAPSSHMEEQKTSTDFKLLKNSKTLLSRLKSAKNGNAVLPDGNSCVDYLVEQSIDPSAQTQVSLDFHLQQNTKAVLRLKSTKKTGINVSETASSAEANDSFQTLNGMPHNTDDHNYKTEVSMMSCNICGKTLHATNFMALFKSHMKMHVWEKPFLCEFCGKRFRLKKSHKRHLLIHDKIKPHLCHQCGQSFVQKISLNHHMATQHRADEKDDITEEHLKSTALLQSTVTRKHDYRRKVLVCHICGQTLSSRSALSGHMSSLHSAAKPFVCRECDMTFSSYIRLKRHSVVHDEMKSTWQCATCEKVFIHRTSLTLHMAIKHDTGSHRYRCAVCGKTFLHRNGLVKHVRVHTGDRPFRCRTCGRAFANKQPLKQHEAVTHGGVKLLQCSVCGLRVGWHGTLKRHMLTHTGERPYACDMCSKAYRANLDLRLHRTRIHGTNEIKNDHVYLVKDRGVKQRQQTAELLLYVDVSDGC